MGAMLFLRPEGARASRAWPAPTGQDWAAVSRRGRGPQSLVTRLISARLVTPLRTFNRADWRGLFWAVMYRTSGGLRMQVNAQSADYLQQGFRTWLGARCQSLV